MKNCTRINKLFFALVLLLPACSKNDPAPGSLLGKWTDDNQVITFYSNMSYGAKNLHYGSGIDTVITDSLWGNYTYQSSNRQLSFVVTGYHKRNGKDTTVNYTGNTWNITFINNNEIEYQSSSTLGYLNRVQ